MDNPRRKKLKRSKWAVYEILENNERTFRYIPETQWMNKENLAEMLDTFEMVYVKPDNWTWGRGVIKVEKIKIKKSKPQFRYQIGRKISTFHHFTDFIEALELTISKKMKNRNTNDRKYIIQQGIHLLKYNDRIFDLRLMVQKSPEKHFEVTGILGRLAHPKRIVTNFHSKGEIYSIEHLLQPYMAEEKLQKYKASLEELAKQIGPLFNRKAIGIDIGIDENFFPWIIEVNMKPDPYVFNQLNNKNMFNKIIEYRKYWKEKRHARYNHPAKRD